MSHGGKREGAGRKAGALQKIKPRKLSAERIAAQLSLAPEDTPLHFLLAVMQDKLVDKDGQRVVVKFKDQFNAAIAAAPYVHAKLASIEVKGNSSEPLTLESDIGKALKEIAERARRINKIIDHDPSEVLEPATLPDSQKQKHDD